MTLNKALDFVIVIPARFASSRLPGKPLLDLLGKPMIQRVYEQACQVGAREVVVATDDLRVKEAVEAFGGQVLMTSADHPSGTDRLAEVAQLKGWGSQTLVVNVQGDEPLIPAQLIHQVARNLADHPQADIATLSEPIERLEDFLNPNIVKVVSDHVGMALYFSRASIPWPRDAFAGGATALPAGLVPQRHIGMYAYRAGFLGAYQNWPSCELEQWECLEQLRALYQGHRIHVATAEISMPGGVDTEADYQRVLRYLQEQA